MKKILSLILVLVMVFGLGLTASGETPFPSFGLGDKADDFTATLLSGEEVSLYQLLETKKAVFISFWATWCSPCQQELPHIQAAWEKYPDVAFLCISDEENTPDTLETIHQMWESLGLTLPVSLDMPLAYTHLQGGYPTNVVIDRNGVLCYAYAGAFTSADLLESLLDVYVDPDYSEPVLMEEGMSSIPILFRGEAASDEELAAALNPGEGMELSQADPEEAWPFLPGEVGIVPSNSERPGTSAAIDLKVTSQEGDVFVFDYAGECDMIIDGLNLYIDDMDTPVMVYGGQTPWTSASYPLGQGGEHHIRFRFQRDVYSDGYASVSLHNPRILSQEEALEQFPPILPVQTLEGKEMTFEVAQGNVKYLNVKREGTEPNRYFVKQDDEELVLRIRIGKDVDPARAFVHNGSYAVTLEQLPQDELGYLFVPQAIPAAVGMEDLKISDSVMGTDVIMARKTLSGDGGYQMGFMSEEDALNYVKLEEAYVSMYMGMTLEYGYVDGSPFPGNAMDQPEEGPLPAAARYRITLTDPQGSPISGAKVQFCTDKLCFVAYTDDQGQALYEGDPYPCEIHILEAPGYKTDRQAHVMPLEGGELNLVLEKE